MQVRFAEQLLDLMVGAARFELATTCTPCARGFTKKQ